MINKSNSGSEQWATGTYLVFLLDLQKIMILYRVQVVIYLRTIDDDLAICSCMFAKKGDNVFASYILTNNT